MDEDDIGKLRIERVNMYLIHFKQTHSHECKIAASGHLDFFNLDITHLQSNVKPNLTTKLTTNFNTMIPLQLLFLRFDVI